MKQKSKLFILSFIVSIVLFAAIPSYVDAATPVATSATTLSDPGDHARKDNIQWVYQTINGVTYRRQYNFTKGVWVGDWEYVG